MNFADFSLDARLNTAIEAAGYTAPTPIQEQAIPLVMSGRDVLGLAQTGTGKTAAFALPILQRLHAVKPVGQRLPRALVIAPTRELAIQITGSFKAYGQFLSLTYAVIFGGVGQDRQVRELGRGVDILVATPGRLLDLMGQGFVKLNKVEVLVLDEADRMLDMGFINDVRRVLKALPVKRQTLLFSATMPTEVSALARSILSNPVNVAVTPVATTAARIDESIIFVAKAEKTPLLAGLLQQPAVARSLIFTRTKHGADRLVRQLGTYQIMAEALHGNKSQNVRQRTLDGFRTGRLRFLVATDIAARGIDVEGITHIVNYDLPVEPEAYVHRIGRTARAGASGIAVSLCSEEEREALRNIEKLLKRRVPVARGENRPAPAVLPPAPPAMPERAPAQGRTRQALAVPGRVQQRPASPRQGMASPQRSASPAQGPASPRRPVSPSQGPASPRRPVSPTQAPASPPRTAPSSPGSRTGSAARTFRQRGR